MTPECKSIQVVNVPVDMGLQDIYDTIDCTHFGMQSFTHQDSHYGIYYDDEGLLNGSPFNKCARKLLSKIKGIMWSYQGSFLIYKFDINDECDATKLDMDITPREFVNRFNSVMRPPSMLGDF